MRLALRCAYVPVSRYLRIAPPRRSSPCRMPWNNLDEFGWLWTNPLGTPLEPTWNPLRTLSSARADVWETFLKHYLVPALTYGRLVGKSTFGFFWRFLVTFGKPEGPKTCPWQFVTALYHSFFHTSSGPGEDSGKTNTRCQTDTVTDIYTNSS